MASNVLSISATSSGLKSSFDIAGARFTVPSVTHYADDFTHLFNVSHVGVRDFKPRRFRQKFLDQLFRFCQQVLRFG